VKDTTFLRKMIVFAKNIAVGGGRSDRELLRQSK
jgi:hypothetical protein